MTHSFFIPCIPPKSTHQAGLRIMKRADGKQFVGRFATSKSRKAQDALITMLMPHRPPNAPLPGPVALSVVWQYPYRSSEPKRNRSAAIPCTTRPDVDNLLKGLLDCMTRLGWWNDDAQVYNAKLVKVWGPEPGIHVCLEDHLP